MPVKILVFSTRRAGMTPQEYKQYYEEKHVPLIRKLCGDAFPLIYERNYTTQSENHLLGAGGELEFDCVAASVYRDQEHLDKVMENLSKPGNKELREEDEAKFLDMSKIKVVVVESSRDFPEGVESFTAEGRTD